MPQPLIMSGLCKYQMLLEIWRLWFTCAVAGLLVEGTVLEPSADGAGKGCVKLPKPPELCCMAPKLPCALRLRSSLWLAAKHAKVPSA